MASIKEKSLIIDSVACTSQEEANSITTQTPPSLCSVCLTEQDSVVLNVAGTDLERVVRQHLLLERTDFILTAICQRCRGALETFHEFFTMVTEAHRLLLEKLERAHPEPKDNIAADTPDEEPDEEENAIPSTEFIAIKQEPMEVFEEQREEDKDLELPQEEECIGRASGDADATAPSIGPETETIEDAEPAKTQTTGRERRRSARNRQPLGKTGKKDKTTVDQELLEFYKRLVCEICDIAQMATGEPPIEYDNLKELNRHMRRAHGQCEGSVKCPLCEKKFRTRAKLLAHKDMHEHPDRFRCSVCQEVHQNIEEHMQNKHQERTFCCEVCGKRFPFQARLNAHVRKMHTAKDIICEQCNKAFSKYTIEDHKRSVHGNGFICEHCPRSFKSRFQLENHMEEHRVDESGVRPAKATCTICGIVVRNKYNLTTHMKRMHTEQKPVRCESCGKMFKSKHNLDAHRANVCTDRSFPCTICDKRFKKKIKLKEHMTTHTRSALYQCPYCPKRFSFETQLYTHRKQAHYEEWLEIQRKRKEGERFRVNRITD
ncbi:zinc finger protein 43-like [Anopheles albimanus]|uniref:zinc finger protein 43-like n=1 Tax=Anopheles albimanus TaxID=7167 RepID=UPI00164194CC|nr:zinc finger protein 43-like [Anopheles albimanus]